MLDAATLRDQVAHYRANSPHPLNLNFFCHAPAYPDTRDEAAWRNALAPYYVELGIDPSTQLPSVNRAPFDATLCGLVEAAQPEVVSFHFGLPDAVLLQRVRAAGCKVISSATTVAEARWLEQHGCDAVIAQGFEAGGHRGMFHASRTETQVGTLALVPQVVDAVAIPVIAAGGIGDGRGIAAALALGAAGVQIGTAYLRTPESLISDLHRAALREARDDGTALTNLFSGRPARGIVNRLMREIGPLSDAAPPFPTAGGALAPLKARAEAAGRDDFSSLWSGQAGSLARETDCETLTRQLADAALARLRWLGSEPEKKS
jgi:nitronate monooxygenase